MTSDIDRLTPQERWQNCEACGNEFTELTARRFCWICKTIRKEEQSRTSSRENQRRLSAAHFAVHPRVTFTDRAARGVGARRLFYDRVFWMRMTVMPSRCWEWTGTRDEAGYGVVIRNRKEVKAHRYALILSGVTLGPKDHACHHCDNPPCCNPAHLFVGSGADNIADMVAKRRHAFGERNGHAKLTEPSVVEIIRRSRIERTADLAREFGITQGYVRHIRGRRTWKHISA